MKSEESSTWKGLGEFIRAQRQLADLSLRQLAELAKELKGSVSGFKIV